MTNKKKSASTPGNGQAQPNILIFMTDHQRADTVPPFGRAITPNLDRLARNGVTFTNAFCSSPHCCPSRASFFSGLYPSRHGVWNNICNEQRLSRGPNPGVRLFSEDLRDAGYDLYFSGKWHVSIDESPADRGFTELFVSSDKHTHHGIPWEAYDTLSEDEMVRQKGEIIRPGYPKFTIYGERDDEASPHDLQAVEEALKLLPKLAGGTENEDGPARDDRSASTPNNPWCLYVGVNGPHDPYLVHRKYLDMYNLDDIRLPESFGDEMAGKPAVYKRLREQIFGQLSDHEVKEGVRHFLAFCTQLDDMFGRLYAELERTGQAENTLVLYCSDHGDYCGDHRLFAKGIPCFKGAYHIPAIMHWPDGITQPGRTVDKFVSIADFAPTFTELSGRGPDCSLVGRSLLPFLRDDHPADWREDIHTQCNGVELYYTQRSVMTDRYKYVFNGYDFDELYDLKNDPHEMVNLAGDPAYEPVKIDMCRRMWRFAREQQDTVINPYITTAIAPFGPGY